MSNGWTHNKRPNIQTNWKTEEKYWELKHAHRERGRKKRIYNLETAMKHHIKELMKKTRRNRPPLHGSIEWRLKNIIQHNTKDTCIKCAHCTTPNLNTKQAHFISLSHRLSATWHHAQHISDHTHTYNEQLSMHGRRMVYGNGNWAPVMCKWMRIFWKDTLTRYM